MPRGGADGPERQEDRATNDLLRPLRPHGGQPGRAGCGRHQDAGWSRRRRDVVAEGTRRQGLLRRLILGGGAVGALIGSERSVRLMRRRVSCGSVRIGSGGPLGQAAVHATASEGIVPPVPAPRTIVELVKEQLAAAWALKVRLSVADH